MIENGRVPQVVLSFFSLIGVKIHQTVQWSIFLRILGQIKKLIIHLDRTLSPFPNELFNICIVVFVDCFNRGR